MLFGGVKKRFEPRRVSTRVRIEEGERIKPMRSFGANVIGSRETDVLGEANQLDARQQAIGARQRIVGDALTRSPSFSAS